MMEGAGQLSIGPCEDCEPGDGGGLRARFMGACETPTEGLDAAPPTLACNYWAKTCYRNLCNREKVWQYVFAT